jgi:glycosyltransferase involved in cell wall biosynthesis
MTEPSVELSVVVPVYGCVDCLRALEERIRAALEPAVSSYELVLVDDRSPDGAWAEIRRLAAADPRVRGVRLSRNFGQHAAITAGLSESRGQWTAVMDCDLQEPPEALPELMAKAREGFDIVHTRRQTPSQSWLRRGLGQLYFRVRDALQQTSTGRDHGTMSVLSRPALEAFLSLGDRDREYLALLGWLGFETTIVEVGHAERHAGRSSYSLRRLVGVAVDGIFFQTTVLLRWIVFAGFTVAAIGALLALYLLTVWVFDDPPSGYTSLAVLLLLLSGMTIVCVGVTGLYVGKTFEQAKGRPLFIVAERAEARERVETSGE